MEREACVCDHGYERSDLCAEIIIILLTRCYHHWGTQLRPMKTFFLTAFVPTEMS